MSSQSEKYSDGVLWAGLSNILPLNQSTRRRFALINNYAPHIVVAAHLGYRFLHFKENVDFYLVSRAFPFFLRVPLFVFWLWLITTYAVLFRGVRVLVSQSTYEGFLLWLIRLPLGLFVGKVALVVQLQGFNDEVIKLNHRWLRYTSWIWEKLLWFAVRKADVVRAISNATYVLAEENGAKRIVSYPTWTDWELFLEAQPMKMDVPSGTFELLFVGDLTHVKGVDILLEAVRLLQKRGHAVSLRVVGSGREEQNLKDRMVSLNLENVIWMGRLSLNDVVPCVVQCSALIVPSRSEGLGRVALEAAACRKPVVASNVGGLPDAVIDGETGILFPSEDVDALAGGVEYLILNPDEAQALGERGRLRVEREFGTQAWMDGYVEVLQIAWHKVHV